MPTDQLRSIVPMFGGATYYVRSLNSQLSFIETHHPTTDELVQWHRETFANVSSRDSIMRRVQYLRRAGFLHQEEGNWELGAAGKEYTQDYKIETLLRIMCDRNIGLRSLLYALSAGSMTIEEISAQQLDTHPELGWNPTQTDMAHQRANWLRSMGLVQKNGSEYVLTEEGQEFVDDAVGKWANSNLMTPEINDDMTAGTYETVVNTRAVDPEFRATVLSRYGGVCPVSGVDHVGLLDVAHILSWSEYPHYRADLSNVIPLSKTHHAAFDHGLFTIDQKYRLQVNPGLNTQSSLLKQTIVDRDGERVSIPNDGIDPDYLRQHNSTLEWL